MIFAMQKAKILINLRLAMLKVLLSRKNLKNLVLSTQLTSQSKDPTKAVYRIRSLGLGRLRGPHQTSVLENNCASTSLFYLFRFSLGKKCFDLEMRTCWFTQTGLLLIARKISLFPRTLPIKLARCFFMAAHNLFFELFEKLNDHCTVFSRQTMFGKVKGHNSRCYCCA